MKTVKMLLLALTLIAPALLTAQAPQFTHKKMKSLDAELEPLQVKIITLNVDRFGTDAQVHMLNGGTNQDIRLFWEVDGRIIAQGRQVNDLNGKFVRLHAFRLADGAYASEGMLLQRFEPKIIGFHQNILRR